jgi:hypothetical protein
VSRTSIGIIFGETIRRDSLVGGLSYRWGWF